MSVDDAETNFVQQCPFCARYHESKDHDVDWYFACCGYARLVWRREVVTTDEGGVGTNRLKLEIVPEDAGGPDYTPP